MEKDVEVARGILRARGGIVEAGPVGSARQWEREQLEPHFKVVSMSKGRVWVLLKCWQPTPVLLCSKRSTHGMLFSHPWPYPRAL